MTLPIRELYEGAVTKLFTDEKTKQGWFPCNVAIAKGIDSYGVIRSHRNIVRDLQVLNGYHTLDKDGRPDPSGIFCTRNFFATLDPITLKVNTPWIEIPQPDVPVLNGSVTGVEDPRLFYNNGWYFTANIYQHHITGRPRTAICDIGGHVIRIIDAPEDVDVKNIMPTGSTPELIDIMALDTGLDDTYLHGGAVCQYENGFLGIVHNIDWPGRIFKHRFVLFDAAGQFLKASKRFTFNGVFHIEVATGIVIHESNVIVSFGIMEREVWFAQIPIENVLGELNE
jgi:hypothetical protein